MKPRTLLLVFASIVSACAVGMAMAVKSAFPEADSERVVIAPDIVGVNTGHAMAYLIRAHDEVILIDAGDDPAGRALLTELARQGQSAHAVRHILITHGHSDHVAAIPQFPDATTHVADADHQLLRGDRLPLAALPRLLGHLHPQQTFPAHVEPTLPGALLTFGGRTFEVIATPGHTPGACMYRLGKLLFSGDSLERRGDELGPAPVLTSDDPRMAIRALERLRDMPFVGVADGHTGYTPDGRVRFELALTPHPTPDARQ